MADDVVAQLRHHTFQVSEALRVRKTARRLLPDVRGDLASARVEDFARARPLGIVGGIAHQLLSWHVTSVASISSRSLAK